MKIPSESISTGLLIFILTSKEIPETWGNPVELFGNLDTPNSKASKITWPGNSFTTILLNQGNMSIILPLVIFPFFKLLFRAQPFKIHISAFTASFTESETRLPSVHSL